MPDKHSHGERLQSDIDKLKDPTPYISRFETKETQELSQAIDILWRLASEAHNVDASKVGLDKLTNAKIYLDRLLHKHFGDPEQRD
jgi:hypothetical protein